MESEQSFLLGLVLAILSDYGREGVYFRLEGMGIVCILGSQGVLGGRVRRHETVENRFES